MYKFLIRPILFLFNPERVHHAVLTLLSIIGKLPGVLALLSKWFTYKDPKLEQNLFGLHFHNPVGLAAGFDKNGKWINEMACFGFGFIEIGTITPKTQVGNAAPRLYRLPFDRGLINRMGFNNAGAQAVANRMKERGHRSHKKSEPIIGGNIGKNKYTPNKLAMVDYEQCFQILYPYVDYFVINVSSPNTPGLRDLQSKEPLLKLLCHIKALSNAKKNPKPILLKIDPDLSSTQLKDVVAIISESRIDGVVATNTTVHRKHLRTSSKKVKKIGDGGLSGAPLTQQATDVIRFLRQNLGEHFPIIGVGGIMSVQDALDKMKAGANLIQLYTGFIYEGPSLVKQINRALCKEWLARKP